MVFLNPVVLFGLLAASIPILLHFLNLKKLKKINFSTLAFLKELQKTKIRRVKLKQWLLLLLRVLIITFLVLAFARPTIRNFNLGSSSANTSAAFIIDNTFSMSVISNEGSYFNKAKQLARLVADNFQDGDEITIVPVSRSADNFLSPKSNLSHVKKDIDDLQISFARKTLYEAILQAGQILYQSKNYNRELYIFTDLQTGSFYNALEELSDLKELLKDTRIYLFNFSDKEVYNLGIDELINNNQIIERGKTLSFTAVIKNYSDISVSNSVASLFINDNRKAQKSFSLTPKEERQIDFETTLNDTGLVNVWVELEDDDIKQDNARFTSIYVPNEVNLLIIEEKTGDSKFVEMALTNSDENSLRVTKSIPSRLSSINLDKYNALVIIGTIKSEDFEKVRAYNESGGGLLIFPGTDSSITSLRLFNSSLGLSTPTSFYGKINSTTDELRFDNIDIEHPVFRDLFIDETKTKVESPDIYFSVNINPNSNGRNIISLTNNSSFLSEYKNKNGKIFLFNTAPVLSSSNFPVKSLFAPLLRRTVSYLTSDYNEQKNIYSGEELLVNLKKKFSNTIKVITPQNYEEYINTDSISSSNYFSYTKTENGGSYKFLSNDKLIDYAAVNHDPRESITDYQKESDFEKFCEEINYEGNLFFLNSNEDFSKQIYQSRFGTEIWKHFIIIALILALIEMYVAKSSKKDLTELSI